MIHVPPFAPALSQPLAPAPLQQLEEAESPLLRRHSNQGLPPLHRPAATVEPCEYAVTLLCAPTHIISNHSPRCLSQHHTHYLYIHPLFTVPLKQD